MKGKEFFSMLNIFSNFCNDNNKILGQKQKIYVAAVEG